MQSRRNFLTIAGAALLGAPMVNRGRFALYGGQREYSRRTVDLVGESLVIDMLGLITLDWNLLAHWQAARENFTQSDYEKLLSSGITVFNPAVDMNSPDPHTATLEWMRDWNVFLDSHPRKLIRVDRVNDLLTAKAKRRTGVIMGFQNADHFRTVADVQYFYKIGQRISQLTYNATNPLGSGCIESHDGGLTDFGAAIVGEMNRLGMAIDVSHCGDVTTREAIDLSKQPVLITHSNCRALNPHPRCKTDEAIRRMAAKGGVLGITGIRRFVSNREPTTIEDVLDHFDHVIKLVGIEHIGVGSDNDLDGRDKRMAKIRMDIDGLDQPHRMYELTEGLVRRGYSDENIRLVLGGNFQRALTAVWGA